MYCCDDQVTESNFTNEMDNILMSKRKMQLALLGIINIAFQGVMLSRNTIGS